MIYKNIALLFYVFDLPTLYTGKYKIIYISYYISLLSHEVGL